MARRTDNLNPTPYERASLERQARRASKQFNANAGRGIPVSPNDRRLPGAMANVQATPQAEPVVMTPDQLAPINEKFANKGIFAGDPSTVPFSDVTEDARRFAQADMRTPTQKMAAKPPTPATPQDKAAVLLNMYRESLMPQMPATPGGPMPPKAPADAKSFLNTPSYDMDYGTIQELQKTREGKIALADIQERQKRFTKSITAIATQMGLGEIGRSDEGMQEFYERAIYGNPEYSPLIAGFAKGMFMKTMPPNIGRQMERERADAEKRTRAEAQNKWNEEHGIEKRYDPWGNEYSPPKPVEEKPTIREIIAQQKQAADEKMAALQELYPDKKFKIIDPVKGEVGLDDQTPEEDSDNFPGTPFYQSQPDEYKANIRAAGQYIQSGGKILRFDPKSGMTPLPLGATPEEEAQAKQIRDLFEKTYMQTQSPNPAPGVQPAQPQPAPAQPADDFETAKSIFAQNYEALAADNSIEEKPIEGRPGWVRVRFPDPVTGLFYEFIVEKNI